MTERKEATRETSGGPSPAPELVPSGVHAKGVLEGFACDPHCCKLDSAEDSTLIVRNDRNLLQIFSPLARAFSFLPINESGNARVISERTFLRTFIDQRFSSRRVIGSLKILFFYFLRFLQYSEISSPICAKSLCIICVKVTEKSPKGCTRRRNCLKERTASQKTDKCCK